MQKSIAAAAVATVIAAGLFAAAPASALTASTRVVGGEKAPATASIVQLQATGGTIPAGYASSCTGEQISASWVLTARHCIDGIGAMNVYHSNSTVNRGTPVAVDRISAAPTGDVALVHLRTAYALSSYTPLDLAATAKSSGTGTIQGYGLRANAVQSDGLYQASVSLTGASTDAFGGRAQHVTGVSGASNHGDSGGPLIVNGKVVGVCSTGDSADPGANTRAGSNYALLAQASSWIRSTAGI
ncbi:MULTISPECIES: S1 family peptidase [Curtobacterium]|uniref:S1 family peptidase n=1 Tax=Curtobacterium TaxID=2034 RepID=UPI000DA9817B|nr:MULTISPECIES: S1 family peptidase [Curtobacterium]MBY0176166.1 S1 family peptidase [Curtobacterium herbarum]MDN3477716.1 S1 family peptidase [Curtobacterium sp. APC 4022]MDY1003990.1 S1 family peptidase [Curtobacterium sp. CFBP9011]WIE61806.1 S1 family peptidase [Curtobacterium sp. MCLR17_032]